MKRILLIICLLALIFFIGGCITISPNTSKVTIIDAYCDNDGHFNFTVVNAQPSGLNITYKWHLDDPQADSPRPIWDHGYSATKFYIGDGDLSIPGNSNKTVVILLPPDPSYPQNNLVMDIGLFNGNISIYHYREQKSSYYWDYRSLPPKEFQWAEYIQNPSVQRGTLAGYVVYKNGSIMQSTNVSLWFNGTIMGSGIDNTGSGFRYEGIPYGHYEIVDMDASGKQRIASAYVNVNSGTINVNLTIGEYASE